MLYIKQRDNSEAKYTYATTDRNVNERPKNLM